MFLDWQTTDTSILPKPNRRFNTTPIKSQQGFCRYRPGDSGTYPFWQRNINNRSNSEKQEESWENHTTWVNVHQDVCDRTDWRWCEQTQVKEHKGHAYTANQRHKSTKWLNRGEADCLQRRTTDTGFHKRHRNDRPSRGRKVNPNFMPFAKTNSKWIKALNVTCHNTLLEETAGHLHYPVEGKEFSDTTLKAQSTSWKVGQGALHQNLQILFWKWAKQMKN